MEKSASEEPYQLVQFCALDATPAAVMRANGAIAAIVAEDYELSPVAGGCWHCRVSGIEDPVDHFEALLDRISPDWRSRLLVDLAE